MQSHYHNNQVQVYSNKMMLVVWLIEEREFSVRTQPPYYSP